jgi:hypothetical protein
MSARSFNKHFQLQPYEWSVYFFTDRAKWIRFAARRTGTTQAIRAQVVPPNVGGITLCRIEHQECILGVFDGEPGTLAHEAVHAATIVLHNAGVKMHASNDEPLAYVVGHIVDSCAAALIATWRK